MIPVTIDVLRATVEELTGRITPENRRAILMVIDQYTKRIGRLQQRIGDTDPQGFEQIADRSAALGKGIRARPACRHQSTSGGGYGHARAERRNLRAHA